MQADFGDGWQSCDGRAQESNWQRRRGGWTRRQWRNAGQGGLDGAAGLRSRKGRGSSKPGANGGCGGKGQGGAAKSAKVCAVPICHFLCSFSKILKSSTNNLNPRHCTFLERTLDDAHDSRQRAQTHRRTDTPDSRRDDTTTILQSTVKRCESPAVQFPAYTFDDQQGRTAAAMRI